MVEHIVPWELPDDEEEFDDEFDEDEEIPNWF